MSLTNNKPAHFWIFARGLGTPRTTNIPANKCFSGQLLLARPLLGSENIAKAAGSLAEEVSSKQKYEGLAVRE